MNDVDESYEDDDAEPNHLRTLREKAKEADRLRKEMADLQSKLAHQERDAAFRAAGIDPTDSRQSYFVKGYDGEVTIEAIQAAARDAGFLAAAAPENPPAEQTQGWVEAARINASAAAPPVLTNEAALRDEIANIPYGDPRAMAEQMAAILERHGQPVSRHGVFLEG